MTRLAAILKVIHAILFDACIDWRDYCMILVMWVVWGWVLIVGPFIMTGCGTAPRGPSATQATEAASSAYQAATGSTLGWLAVACGFAGIACLVAGMIVPSSTRTGVTLIVTAVLVAIVPWVLTVIEPQVSLVAWIGAGAAAVGIVLLGLRAWERHRGHRDIEADIRKRLAKIRSDRDQETDTHARVMDDGAIVALTRVIDPAYERSHAWDEDDHLRDATKMVGQEQTP